MGGQEVARDASRAAWYCITTKAHVLGDMQSAVFNALRKAKEGLIEEEIRASIGANPNSVRGRLIELERMGLVARTGRTRPTSTGRRAQVWVSA
jgi:transcription initiation factor IIE alpha subunit